MTGHSWLKRWALATLNIPLVGRVLSSVRGPRCIILMLHRFRHPDGNIEGHRTEQLVELLEYLRAIRVDVLPLHDAIDRFANPGARPLRSAVAFTVDDCYTDLRDVGGPLFARYDCPVTGFVVPDVVDGKRWYWWDHVEWLLRQTGGRRLTIELDGLSTTVDCRTAAATLGSVSLVCDALKVLPTRARETAVEELSHVLGCPLPRNVPPEYAVMTWDELRKAEHAGMQFGPHSVSHPVLSRCSDDESECEILKSISRLSEELRNPSPVFCYPVGRREDFGVREMRTVEQAGLFAAVSAIPSVILPNMDERYGPEWRWSVPRFSYDGRRGAAARRLLL
jgi:peptidoglycan/xylan/chitin deacetylase (PgdA/CDA1 family)